MPVLLFVLLFKILLPSIFTDFPAFAVSYSLQPRGEIDVKGKGRMTTYWILEGQGHEICGAGPLSHTFRLIGRSCSILCPQDVQL